MGKLHAKKGFADGAADGRRFFRTRQFVGLVDDPGLALFDGSEQTDESLFVVLV